MPSHRGYTGRGAGGATCGYSKGEERFLPSRFLVRHCKKERLLKTAIIHPHQAAFLVPRSSSRNPQGATRLQEWPLYLFRSEVSSIGYQFGLKRQREYTLPVFVDFKSAFDLSPVTLLTEVGVPSNFFALLAAILQENQITIDDGVAEHSPFAQMTGFAQGVISLHCCSTSS